MGKTPLPKDEALQPLNVKVPMEDLYFLQEELKPALGTSYNADAMRQVLAQLRTWFRLPAYVVDRLKKDARAQNLHLLEYLQMLLHKRYEELVQGPKGRSLGLGPGADPEVAQALIHRLPRLLHSVRRPLPSPGAATDACWA